MSSGDIDRGPFDIEVVITGDATEFQIPTGDALGDAVYQWRVIARDRALNTSSSVTRIFTVDTLAPGAPALVTPLDAPVRESFLDTRSPFLKWAPSTGDVFDYRLQVTSGDINTGPFDVDKEILDPTTGDLVVLNGDGTYQWRVIARDLALNTASSVVRSFVVDIVAPAAPELVSPPPLPDAGAFINTGSIFLKWDPSASIGDVFDYRLQVTSPGGSFNDPVVIDREIVHPTTGAQITLVTPTGDGVYQWRVIARDRAFNLGTSDTRAFRLDTTPPGVPTLVFPETGDFISDNTPRFDWDASAGDETGNPAVENYILQVVRSGDDFVAGPFVIEATRGRFFTNFQVPAGDELVDDTYRWRVIARDRARNVNTSATRTFTVDTVPPGVPALVAPPTAAVLNTGTPKFEWVPTTLVVETATGNGIRTVFALTRNPIDRDFDDVLTTADVIVEHPVDTVLSTADYTVDHVTDTVTFVVPPGTGGGANNIRFIFAVTGDLARDVFGYVLFVTSGDPFADAFDIQKVITGDPAATVFQVPTGDTLADAGYVWRVVAFDRALNEARSDISGFVVDTVPPGVPTLVAPVAPAFLNTGAVLFDWEDLKGQPQEFRLQVTTADIDTGPFVIDVVIKTADGTEFQVPPGDALADDTYQWRVTSTDRALNTAQSVTETFTVDIIPPVAPELVSPDDGAFLNTATPSFDWNDSPSTEDVDVYLLRVTGGDIDTGPFDIDVVITGETTEFQVPPGDALADALYLWRVIPRDRALNTDSSVTRIFIVDTISPVAPALVAPGRQRLPEHHQTLV